MGSRAAVAAVKDMVLESKQGTAFLQNIVLAAPDIDIEVFRGLAQAMNSGAKRVTLYASSNDEALKLSRRLHGYQRAGESGDQILIAKGLDTIDATGVDTSLLGHSYYGDNRSIISDNFYLLRDGKPPGERFGLVPRLLRGLTYYSFKE